MVDIFRVEGGKIVEHWDVSLPVNDKPANKNTMFWLLRPVGFVQAFFAFRQSAEQARRVAREDLEAHAV